MKENDMGDSPQVGFLHYFLKHLFVHSFVANAELSYSRRCWARKAAGEITKAEQSKFGSLFTNTSLSLDCFNKIIPRIIYI